MGAIFYNYSGNSIIKQPVGNGTTTAKIDLFEKNNLTAGDNLCIITQIGVQTSEIIQYFLTFDDFIHHYWFGKGLGSITVQGMLFMDCDNDKLPGLSKLLTAVGNSRGKKIECSLESFSFTGVLNDCSINVVGEPETMANFSLSMAMINHTLPPPTPRKPAC